MLAEDLHAPQLVCKEQTLFGEVMLPTAEPLPETEPLTAEPLTAEPFPETEPLTVAEPLTAEPLTAEPLPETEPLP
jgi:hypothetical protein